MNNSEIGININIYWVYYFLNELINIYKISHTLNISRYKPI